ncbi:MAG: type IV pilus assembly protein PilM [Algisphaera sp.]
MAKKNEAWGIDVGSNAIKAIKLVRSGDEVRVADFEVLPYKHVLTTPDYDADAAVRDRLEAFLAKHSLEKTPVVTAVPGNMAFARFAKLPPVEAKKIPSIVRFEAQQQIPFPIEDVEWDYQVFQEPDDPDIEVGIFAITKDRVVKHLSNYRAMDIRLEALTLSPVAVYNAFQFDKQGHAEGTVYMDIGTVSTDVIIVEEGGIWLRTLPIGGNNFTEALVKQFKISFPKAEKLKREAATSKYAKQIFQAMRAVFADLVQEVQRSLGYYQSINRDSKLTELVGLGSTFKLPGLQKFLKQQLQMKVIRPQSFERLKIDGRREADFSSHAMNMATAYGLALQGLKLERVTANVLPSHVIAARVWKAKQPWIAASAACFVAAAGLVGTKYFVDAQALSDSLDRSSALVKPVLNRADGFVSQLDEIRSTSDPRQFIENLRRVLDHRDIWSHLIEDIGLATLAIDPQPEMLGNDFAAQAAIPRGQRRRLYIDGISSVYQAKPSDKASVNVNFAEVAAKTFTIDQFFTAGTDAAEGEEATPSKGPQFLVTIRGRTPLAQADKALNNQFLGWLRDHADQENRPYVFKFPKGNPIRSLSQVTGAASTSASASTAKAAGNYRGASAYGGGRGGAGGGEATTVNVSEILPRSPLADESVDGDWEFVVQLIVELRSPEAARPRVDHTPSRPKTEVPVDVEIPETTEESVPLDEAVPVPEGESIEAEPAADASVKGAVLAIGSLQHDLVLNPAVSQEVNR